MTKKKRRRKLKKPTKDKIKSLLMLILIWVFFVYTHEIAHGTIYRYFGCENVTYGYQETYFYTACEDDDFYCNDACSVAHSNNEIVGYSVMPFVLIGLGVLMSIARTYSRAVRQQTRRRIKK